MFANESVLPCSSDPELWFSGVKSKIERAKQLCHTCPRMLACREQALETQQLMGTAPLGVHGALTPAERTKLLLKRTA